MRRLAASAIFVALATLPGACLACSAYSCDGVGWQDYDPDRPGVMAAYQAARRAGTVEALDRFIRDYPGSPAASSALDEKSALEETRKGADSSGTAGTPLR